MVIESTLPHNEPCDKEASTLQRALPQFIAVGVKNLVLFGYGLMLGFPTIIIPAIQGGDGRENSNEEQFHLNPDQISWISSINLLCVPMGCFMSGVITEPTGKRRAMQLVTIPLLISWLLFYFATSIDYLYAGLALAGLSGGLMEAPVLTYVAEVTQPQFRGMLAATGTTCVITGIFVQFILGSFLTWRNVALVCAFMPIITIVALCFVPESPYWLLTKGRVSEARSALCWLRGWVTFSHVEQEFDEIYNALSVRRKEATEAKLLPFYKRFEPFTSQGFISPFVLVSATFFIGHFSGKTPLQTYAVQIFHTLKAPIDKYYATIILGAAELVGAFTCVLLVHITGKRPLVFTSLIGTGICFFATATYANYLDLVPGVGVDNVISNRLPSEAHHLTANVSDLIASLNQSSSEEVYNSTDFGESSYPMNTSDGIGNTSDNVTLGDISKIILPIPNAEENVYLWIPLTLIITGAYFAHLGIRVVPWMLIGEVFPVNVRSAASGLSSGIGYICAFLSNYLFLHMVSWFTLPGTFWFYSAIAIIGCVILYFKLPETEGRKLIDIEEQFTGRKLLADKALPLPNANDMSSVSVENNNSNKNNNINNNNNNSNSNSISLAQIVKPKIEPATLSVSNNNNVNGSNKCSEPQLSIPEILISSSERSSNAGSKRYKHRISDASRSRISIASITTTASVESVQDTHL